ncbi:hypothetical protein Ahia01_001383300 [Argonauta hians]
MTKELTNSLSEPNFQKMKQKAPDKDQTVNKNMMPTTSLPGKFETTINVEDLLIISNNSYTERRRSSEGDSPSVRVSVQCTEMNSSALSVPTEINRSDCNDIENLENVPLLLENKDTLKKTTPHNNSEELDTDISHEQNLTKPTDETQKDHASGCTPEADSEKLNNPQTESRPEQCSRCSREHILYAIIIVLVVVLIGAIVGLPISNKSPSKQYLMCELNRDKLSTTQDGPVVLPWNIQRDQKYGDIQVVNDTVIIVPVEGVYDIQVTFHEEIPKDMPQLAIMTVTFEGEKGIFEGYKRLIEGSGVDKPMTMNFSLRRLLRANEKIWIKRNLAQYNRIKQPSGTLTITKIN